MAAKRAAKAGRDQRQEEVRARVVEAARELFEAKGAAGLSIRAIAARAGLPAMTLYSYFPNKTAIVRALWSLAFDPLFAELRAVEAAEPDAKLRLRKSAQAYVDYWLRHPDRYRMVFLIEDRREAGQDRWFIDETDVVRSYMRFGDLVAQARGGSARGDAREAEAMICALNGIVHMLVTVSEYPWRPAADYVETLLKAFD